MIVVKIEGGLANKMFQFALYKAIAQHSDDVYIDESSFKPSWDFEDIRLSQIFDNVKADAYTPSKFRLANRHDFFSKSVKVICEKLGYRYYREKGFKYNKYLIQNLSTDCYLTGYWQTEKYFKQIETIIKNCFNFRPLSDSRNIKLAAMFEQEESVSIHIRKGPDYDKIITKGTCEIDYYERAIDYILNAKTNPKFYIFTDNPNWVRSNIKKIEYTLIDWNPTAGVNNYVDMQLMSLAKNNIIANSSYSWWGAWLNKNPQKIVIAPRVWFNPKSAIKATPDIIPTSWVSL